MHALIAKCISLLYVICNLLPKRKRITLFSRQGRHISLDFRMLAEALHKHCPDIDIHICTTEPESVSKGAFALSIPSMIYYVATSRVCILEDYIPAVSIPQLDKQTRVIQLWHALGAIKKFGYQSIGTTAGRSQKEASLFRMHKNYDWIIAAGPGSVEAYAEAFGCKKDMILPLGMPRMDYLLDFSDSSPRLQKAKALRERYALLSNGVTRILYAPTFRNNHGNYNWITHEVCRLSGAFAPYDFQIIIGGHPLEKDCDTKVLEGLDNVAVISEVASIDLLACVDCVVTDYSAIAFEAGLARKPVWFYVPDIEEYRTSPGLNINPLEEFPSGAFIEPAPLVSAILEKRKPEEFESFLTRYFGGMQCDSTAKLAQFIEDCYADALRSENKRE